jgi:hypothetical protein
MIIVITLLHSWCALLALMALADVQPRSTAMLSGNHLLEAHLDMTLMCTAGLVEVMTLPGEFSSPLFRGPPLLINRLRLHSRCLPLKVHSLVAILAMQLSS